MLFANRTIDYAQEFEKRGWVTVARISGDRIEPGDWDYTSPVRQYVSYLELTEQIVERRARAGNFFLSANTLIMGAIGFTIQNVTLTQQLPLMTLPIAGILVSMVWSRMIISYKQILTARFDTLHAMEDDLPFRPTSYEWELLESNKKRYKSISLLERRIPRIFMAIYTLILLIASIQVLMLLFDISSYQDLVANVIGVLDQ